MVDVSVIIPTYNRLWSLPRAVESARGNHCATEIIVIDDGSSDETWEWLQSQPDVTSIRQRNQGQTYAINRGAAAARGEYIRFLDSDDFLDPGISERQLIAARQTGADIVYARVDFYDELTSVRSETPDLPIWGDFMAAQLGEPGGSHFLGMLFRRELIADVPRRPDFALREDRMFLLEAALKNPTTVKVGGSAGCWVQHGTQMQANYRGLKAAVTNWQHLQVYRRILTELENRGELTDRRKRSAVRVLWPLAHWISYSHPSEAVDVIEWIFRLVPDFRVPNEGLLGWLYEHVGFRHTEQLLSVRRGMKRLLGHYRNAG